MLPRANTFRECFLMKPIVTRICEIIKGTKNSIEAEEKLTLYKDEVFLEAMTEALESLNQVIVEEEQEKKSVMKRKDEKNICFTFGRVKIKRTLMHDAKGKAYYPLDEWMGLRRHQRYSPLVEIKVAEMASESTYRETSRILKEWTSVEMSHQTVGKIVKQVGAAQGQADQEAMEELEYAESLPEGKKVDYLMVEADGVFIRSTQKRKSREVYHGIMYEGWELNGERASLKQPTVIMTTKGNEAFWKEVQSIGAQKYSLEDTQIVANSDGGSGYRAEKFRTAFSQSKKPVLAQLDSYHIYQSLSRAFGVQNPFKSHVRAAIDAHDKDAFKRWTDTYESTLDDEKKSQKLKDFCTYISGNWERIFDWRMKVEKKPQVARGLGAMESNQRHVSFRMKKRGMHWSAAGAEGMVKVKQGILNNTLRGAYLTSQKRSERKQRQVTQKVNMVLLLQSKTRPSVGAKRGKISLNGANSSATGNLAQAFR